MQAVHGDLSLGEWLQFASLHLDGDPYQTSDPSGIVGIEGGSGYLHGILVFRVVSSRDCVAWRAFFLGIMMRR